MLQARQRPSVADGSAAESAAEAKRAELDRALVVRRDRQAGRLILQVRNSAPGR